VSVAMRNVKSKKSSKKRQSPKKSSKVTKTEELPKFEYPSETFDENIQQILSNMIVYDGPPSRVLKLLLDLFDYKKKNDNFSNLFERHLIYRRPLAIANRDRLDKIRKHLHRAEDNVSAGFPGDSWHNEMISALHSAFLEALSIEHRYNRLVD
jgi:hypothetical protein